MAYVNNDEWAKNISPVKKGKTSLEIYKEEQALKNAGRPDSAPPTSYSPYTNKTTEPASSGSNSGGGTKVATPTVSSPTVASPSAQFNVSQSYVDAMNYTNQLLQKLESGRTSYTDQIKDLMGQIQDRSPFTYDVDKDTLFQQYLKSQTETGRQAMMDTMGQAAALTGGYGSSYATSAANQQYNAFIRNAYDNLPEYYDRALSAYQAEGDDLYKRLGMFTDADQTEYQRLYNAYTANYGQAQDMYGQEFSKWNAETGYAWDAAKFAYQQQRDAVADSQWAAEFALRQANSGGSGSSDSLAREKFEFEKQKWADEMALKQSASSQEAEKYDPPSETVKKGALNAYNIGGRDGYLAYLDTLSDNINIEALDNYVLGDKTSITNKVTGTSTDIYSGGLGQTPYNSEKAHYQRSDGTFVDQYGNLYDKKGVMYTLQSDGTYKGPDGKKYNSKFEKIG